MKTENIISSTKTNNWIFKFGYSMFMLKALLTRYDGDVDGFG